MIIHILEQGRALCGIQGAPIQWPEGHVFVSMIERNMATCPGCVRQSQERMMEKSGGVS